MGTIFSSWFSWLRRFGSSGEGETSDTSEPSQVLTFHSSARWQLHFNSSKESSKLMVIDFSASWCGPCRMMEPELQAMAGKFPDVEFIKIDVDELSEVAQEFQVQAMPTFVLVKKGKVVDRVVGARKDELLRKVEKHK